MRLPDGVHFLPRREKLIAMDSDAIVRIETGLSLPGNAKYEIKDRSFADAIGPNLHGDWADFDGLYRIDRRRRVRLGGACCESSVLYSGAKHRGPDKLPNITVIPNLSTLEARGLSRPLSVFGCTMGHYHPAAPGGPRIQEVYEFQSYGMMVIDREAGEVELWVAQDGDKVAVPDGCHMTLFNLGDDDQPLITLDYANPDCNKSDKKLVGSNGPILLVWHDDLEVVFTLNRLYINGRDHSAGVKLPLIGEDIAQRQVRIPRSARLDLGMLLHDQLTKNPDVIGRFAQLGLRIKATSPETELGPLPTGGGHRLQFARPLAEASKPGTQVHRYFIPDAPSKDPGPGWAPGIAGEESRIAAEKERWVQLERKDAPLTIVVEGAGDWVEKCYRPLFGDFVSNKLRDIRVFYVDDTRWKARPEWTNSLERWEIYLDKADVADFTRYRNLRPDVVFIVTPDFTHSGIARSWLGRAALVFVEKPFDSQSDNVDKLLRDLGQRRGTAVLGLDHYQFYALPVHELKPAIVEHLAVLS